ncbi:MAG: SDR family oxidoreductase [Burkholderiales bacterium]|nr:SDR family oxidoreductase [Burkholderiales bacterium]
MANYNFSGKVVLITGAGGGIGRASALAFAQMGASLMLSDINEVAGLETYAVVGMTKSAAAEYGRAGIRINTVCPGVTRTAMMERALAREPKREKWLKTAHPIGRIAEADEVAQAVLWLCSDSASFVTGHQLMVDGGLVAI